ncbi:anaphase-promoting complex subunit 10 [Magnaporthiopsis poae ATCC 64411]|uniref:Anaphase-promoting complex subunit 10 n=1 Tax=Magnaporthiopsis poae (strain ATCC 64411 / 73-15) TaxID=644358 RepID=A0A0C4E3D9_MAGP6|nr:anaphase-promoting complex subunit 10 [Magnaporthiopsis poae ATCC 64411]
MPRPAPRGLGHPSAPEDAHHQRGHSVDDARTTAELHLRHLADRHALEAEEQPEDDLETTDEYEDDDVADAGEVLSDEDPQHWGERQSRGGLGDGLQPDDMMEGDLDVDIHDEEGAPTEDFEYEEMEDTTPVFDPAALGLKEINNLAHFSVSSHKPGNGVAELLSDDLDKYWQSDGQQPHLLTIHFLRRVEIRALRFFVDHTQDESYTPIRILWHAGTGHHDLIQFGEQVLTSPSGWQEVQIEGLGGGADGNSLCCYIVQMHVKENHQNGKDTHIRGIKIYALDEKAPRVGGRGDVLEGGEDAATQGQTGSARGLLGLPALSGTRAGAPVRRADGEDSAETSTPARFDIGGMALPDFMREPEIR